MKDVTNSITNKGVLVLFITWCNLPIWIIFHLNYFFVSHVTILTVDSDREILKHSPGRGKIFLGSSGTKTSTLKLINHYFKKKNQNEEKGEKGSRVAFLKPLA